MCNAADFQVRNSSSISGEVTITTFFSYTFSINLLSFPSQKKLPKLKFSYQSQRFLLSSDFFYGIFNISSRYLLLFYFIATLDPSTNNSSPGSISNSLESPCSAGSISLLTFRAVNVILNFNLKVKIFKIPYFINVFGGNLF